MAVIGSTTDGIQEALNSVAPTNGTVFLAPGVYSNSTKIIVPTNCALVAEPGTVLLVNFVTNETGANIARAITLSSGSTVSGMMVTNFWKDSVFQSCYGLNDKAGDAGATNWTLLNCQGWGDSDCLHFSHSNAIQGTIIGGSFNSRYDAFAIGGGSGHSYTLVDTIIRCIGPSLQTQGAVSTALNNNGSNVFTLYNTTLYASNSGTAYAINSGQPGAQFIAYGGSMWGKPGQNPFNIDGGGPQTFRFYGVSYDARWFGGADATFNAIYPQSLSACLTNIYTPFDFTNGVADSPFSITTSGNDGNLYTNTFTAKGGLNVAEGPIAIGTRTITVGSGSPEGAVAAPTGSLYLRTDGGARSTLYVKTSGSGNTGWTAK